MIKAQLIASSNIHQLQVFLRCREALRERGIDLQSQVGTRQVLKERLARADLIICQQHARDVIDGDYPCLVSERADSSLPWDRTLFERDNVRAIMKIARADDEAIARSRSRVHLDLLKGEWNPSRHQLSKQQLAKLIVGPSLGQFDRMQRWAECEPDLDATRSIDVQFAGNLRPYHNVIVEHRKQCVDAICRMKDRETRARIGRPLRLDAYMDELYNASVVVSPWGNGETCYRDFEAMAAGAVLVKPFSRWVASWPDINKHCVGCAVDFSNLDEIVRDVLAYPGAYKTLREQARAAFVECYSVDWLADRLAAIIRRCAGEA